MSQAIPTRDGRVKSSHSGGGNDCVEMKVTANGAVIGDTKAPAAECFTLSLEAHHGFLAAVRSTPATS